MPTILLTGKAPTCAVNIQASLYQAGYPVVVAHHPAQTLDLLIAQTIDLVLVTEPDSEREQVAFCRQLQQTRDLPCMVLSNSQSSCHRIACLDAGADDVVPGPIGQGELLARVRALLRRYVRQKAAPVFVVGDLKLDTGAQRIWRGKTELFLSKSELQLLHCLIQQQDVVLSPDQLADRMWGSSTHADIQRIRALMAQIRTKIEEHPRRPAYVFTVRKHGFVLSSKPR